MRIKKKRHTGKSLRKLDFKYCSIIKLDGAFRCTILLIILLLFLFLQIHIQHKEFLSYQYLVLV